MKPQAITYKMREAAILEEIKAYLQPLGFEHLHTYDTNGFTFSAPSGFIYRLEITEVDLTEVDLTE